ncbi:MAG TPA: helix-turn-helix domain-containing protein, partial [Bifidobacterium adolescentis]|nr:helix-turn-helix domain-containing protein [Bifidobacterium adolescentis]
MTTMKEIAEQTGVSISTVSLVLNGRDEGRVNPTLASLVRNKATELGYKIN